MSSEDASSEAATLLVGDDGLTVVWGTMCFRMVGGNTREVAVTHTRMAMTEPKRAASYLDGLIQGLAHSANLRAD